MKSPSAPATPKPALPQSKSRKVRGYVKAAATLRGLEDKRQARYDRAIAPLDIKIRLAKDQVTIRGASLNVAQRTEAGQILVLLGIPGPNGTAVGR